jgi:hypothetical protein
MVLPPRRRNRRPKGREAAVARVRRRPGPSRRFLPLRPSVRPGGDVSRRPSRSARRRLRGRAGLPRSLRRAGPSAAGSGRRSAADRRRSGPAHRRRNRRSPCPHPGRPGARLGGPCAGRRHMPPPAPSEIVRPDLRTASGLPGRPMKGRRRQPGGSARTSRLWTRAETRGASATLARTSAVPAAVPARAVVSASASLEALCRRAQRMSGGSQASCLSRRPIPGTRAVPGAAVIPPFRRPNGGRDSCAGRAPAGRADGPAPGSFLRWSPSGRSVRSCRF